MFFALIDISYTRFNNLIIINRLFIIAINLSFIFSLHQFDLKTEL